MPEDYNSYPRSYGGIIFLISSALLFLGAVAAFIWLLVDSAEEHFVKNILYSAAFLVITLGVLTYSLCACKAPRTAANVMWVTMGLGIAVFIVGMCLKDPSPVRFITGSPAEAPAPALFSPEMSSPYAD